MRKLLTAFALVLLTASCDIVKKSQKSKEDENMQEQIETKSSRKGDSVSYVVPLLKYRVKWKDTIIYTTSRQGTVIKTYYGKDGQIYKVDCNAAAIDELRKEIRSLSRQVKTKDKEKTEQINPKFLLYGAIALVIIFIVGFVLLYWLIDKKTAVLNIKKP